MAWSGSNLDEFVLLHYTMRNVGDQLLREIYVGFVCGAGAEHADVPRQADGVTGFLRSWPDQIGCGVDAIAVAYGMNDDGNPGNNQWTHQSPRGATGIVVLGTPADTTRLNYNWYGHTILGDSIGSRTSNWGPRQVSKIGDPFRPIGNDLGRPEGDRNKYYMLRHAEFDYDQIWAAVNQTQSGWLPPSEESRVLARGGYVTYMVSFGPFDLPSSLSAEFSLAIVAGDSVHHDPTAHEQLFDPYNPSPFYDQLDFSSLAENTMWAKWVYDNPGVDSDGDGYFGEYRMCEGDTFWYRGDGVPDFRADVPPPAPEVKVIPSVGKLVIRWNGYLSETSIDPFTRVKDFEGYRVYVGLDSRKSSLSLLSSWDYENYNRHTLVQYASGAYKWVSRELPYMIDSLRILYADPDFDPLRWTRSDPLNYNDTIYYFTKQDYNQSDIRNQLEIHKVYPNAPKPPDDSSLWTEDDITIEHGEPLPKYYEYEYIYDGLPATLSYFVGVTAFDFGFASGGIPAKESNVLNSLVESYAHASIEEVEEHQLDVYVYPNPWRVDADYIDRGLENRDQTQINNRSHRIHFANLPRVCKISIYTIDGDWIRTIDHNHPEGGPQSMHDSWDFITRNTQDVVSGLYYYVVESAERTQIGKFVIIR
jgi:hypothetical protein